MTNKTNNPKSKQVPGKVFDVMPPGQAPASPTSRPVIVGHKPPVQDDQFVPGASSRLTGSPSEDRPLMDHPKGTKVEPATAATEPDKEASNEVAPQATTETEKSPVQQTVPELESQPTTDPPELKAEPAPAEEKPQITTPSSSGEESTTAPVLTEKELEELTATEARPTPEHLAMDQAVEANIEEPTTIPPHSFHQTSEERPARPMTQDDVLTGTSAPVLEHAVVSHHKHHTKWWEWLLIFFLIIVIGLVALNFLLDAEILKVNIDLPHTNVL